MQDERKRVIERSLAGKALADFKTAFERIEALTMLDQRSCLSEEEVSSTRVEMVHTCPDGSIIRPVRSPQNWFFAGSRTLAPAATARSITLSTSST
jgi:hypothetical protein